MSIINNYDKVNTGDIILHSNNTSTGFLLRTATSSLYNHVSIAIRLDEKDNIVLDNSGKLYLLEINTEARYDILTKDMCEGAGLSDVEWCLKRYNIIKVRKLNSRFRNKDLIKLTKKFIEKYRGWKFTKSFLPFISVFIGVPFDNDKRPNKDNKQLFCTELVVKYYEECIAPQFVKFTGIEYNGNLDQIFGLGSNNRCDMYTPEHLSSSLTPNSPVLENHEYIIQKEEADCAVVLFQPIIIILVILVFMFFVLR